MANSFTRILAKKLCRVVICSPPTGLSSGSDIGQPSGDDPSIGFYHDHKYAGRPVSPLLKRVKSEVCSGKASCVCLHCIQPTIDTSPELSPLSFLEASASEAKPSVQVVAHVSKPSPPPPPPTPQARKSESSSSSPVSSPASSGATDYRLTNAFQCRLCSFRAEKLRAYMEHVSAEHPFSGLISFKCHFCPEKFPTYGELVEHSKRYMERIGAGLTPLPDQAPAPNHQEIAAITLH